MNSPDGFSSIFLGYCIGVNNRKKKGTNDEMMGNPFFVNIQAIVILQLPSLLCFKTSSSLVSLQRADIRKHKPFLIGEKPYLGNIIQVTYIRGKNQGWINHRSSERTNEGKETGRKWREQQGRGATTYIWKHLKYAANFGVRLQPLSRHSTLLYSRWESISNNSQPSSTDPLTVPSIRSDAKGDQGIHNNCLKRESARGRIEVVHIPQKKQTNKIKAHVKAKP